MTIIKARWNDLLELVNDQSLASDFESDVIDFQEMNIAGIQAITNNTNGTGTFFLQCSNLRPDDVRNANSFIDYADSERDLNGECNNFGWDLSYIAFRYYRIVYIRGTNSTGTVAINIRAKR